MADFMSEYPAGFRRNPHLFYLDPPYWGCESDYGPGIFGREDFEWLAQILGSIQGGSCYC